MKNKLWPLIVFAGACLVYFWKVIFKGFVPLPGDLMVSAYLPWLEYKWGFPAGVPVKNPLISDIFSQFYIWRSLVSEGWRNMQIPLWNPYSYSGYPLLATFHSGVFYPLNFIHMLLEDVSGWSFMVMIPSFACAVTMYLFLRQIKANKIGAVVGGLIYAYSGFAISWAQFISAAQAMIWMPLIFIVIEKYFESKKIYFLYWLPFIFFLLITSGHFQIMVYISVLTIVYFAWKWMAEKKLRLILNAVIPGILTVGLAAFQLLPTLELTKLGMRSVENYIAEYNYGLLPIKYLTTLIAPDFFGNPATGNFFGVFNYHEAIFYTGVFSIFCLILSLFFFKTNKYVRFFLITAVIAFMLGFDTFLGKALYIYNFPGLSTSAAGRIAVIFSMSLSILSGVVITNLEKISYKKLFFSIGLMGLFYAIAYLLARFNSQIFITDINTNIPMAERKIVSLRNLILPGALVFGYSMILILSKKWKLMKGVLIAMVCFEMFRFGWKYIPFVPRNIVYPETPAIAFIEDKVKTEVFRIDRERAEIMPPATWMQYRLMSPSGYDPMAIKEYTKVYQDKINGDTGGSVNRYSELGRYDSKALGAFNVKYLLAVKRNEIGIIGGKNISWKIDLKKWKMVFETDSTAVLENIDYEPRARFLDSKDGEVKIVSYTPNTIKISYSEGAGKTLLLADTWYPGWKAFENKKEAEIEKCEGIFRCVKLSENEGEVVFDYQPESFWVGARISLISGALTILALLLLRKKKRG